MFRNYIRLYNQIKEEFGQSSKLKNIWSGDYALSPKIFLRPLSIMLAPVFIQLSFSANQVTFLSFLAGTMGNIFFATGIVSLFLPASLLYVTFAVLDYTDGHVARHNKKNTYFGSMIDKMSGIMVSSFTPLLVGFGATKASMLPECLDQTTFLLLSAMASIVNLVSKLLSTKYERVKLKVRPEKRKKTKSVPAGEKGLEYFVRRIMLNMTRGTNHLVLFALTATGVMYLFPLLLLALASMQLVVSILAIFREGPHALQHEKL